MCTNFDDMDIEPIEEQRLVRNLFPRSMESKGNGVDDTELQKQMLLRTVPLDNGEIGYVFTCTKEGPTDLWRCHPCNFVDSWVNLLKHVDAKWHNDNMGRFDHPRNNFSKVESLSMDIAKGQPLPPGMEDEMSGPCKIEKTFERFQEPLIGLEFLLELEMEGCSEPRYLCLLCDKRGDPRSILVHLTSQNHYMLYLRKYFPKLHALIEKLPKSINKRSNMMNLTSHLIAKIEEKYGRLKPRIAKEDVLAVGSHERTIILRKINCDEHFLESEEDSFLENMVTEKYMLNTHLLLNDFPLNRHKKTIESELNKSDSSEKQISSLDDKKTIEGKILTSNDDREDDSDDCFITNIVKPPNASHEPTRNNENCGWSSKSGNESPSPYNRRRYRSSRSKSTSPRRRYRSRTRSPMSRRSHRSPPYSRKPRSPESRRSKERRISLERRRSMMERRRSIERRKSTERPRISVERRRSLERRRSPGQRRSVERPRDPSPDNVWAQHYRSRSPRLLGPHKNVLNRYSSSRNSFSRRSPSIFYDKNHIPEIVTHPTSHLLRTNERSPFSTSESSINNSSSNGLHPKEAFLKEVAALEHEYSKNLEIFTECPENHPAYQEEWKKFWCVRFKELQDEGKYDPHTYDYKPDWIAFWNTRIKELNEVEFNQRLKDVKEKFGMPQDVDLNQLKIDFENVGKKPVSDIKTMWKELTGCEIREGPSRRRRRQRSISPWERDDDGADESPSYDLDTLHDARGGSGDGKNLSNMLFHSDRPRSCSQEALSSISDSESVGGFESPARNRSRRSRSKSNRSRSRSMSPRSSIRQFHDSEGSHLGKKSSSDSCKKSLHGRIIHIDSTVNVITVLRQLSVLELQLGTYVSHVVSLLSAGLALERAQQDSSVDLLTRDNVMFLDLVKEKLKGQLMAGVVPKQMVRTTKYCIKSIEILLKSIPKSKVVVDLPRIPAPPTALLFGSGRPRLPVAGLPPVIHPSLRSALPYGTHVYAHGVPPRYPTPSSMYRDIVSHHPFDRPRDRPDFYPFRRSPSADVLATADRLSRNKDEGSFVIDEKLIAVQIAEELTSQGKADVSEEELNKLINQVVENLKEEQRIKRNAEKGKQEAAVPYVPNDRLLNTPAPSRNNADLAPVIPDGFNLNDVSNSTLAVLQDALGPPKQQPIEDLPESEVIAMLRNFKSLPRLKQLSIIEYLRKLEVSNPPKVKYLEQFVNVP